MFIRNQTQHADPPQSFLNRAGSEEEEAAEFRRAPRGVGCAFPTVDQAEGEDRVHQDAALPEVVAHVLQPVGVQTAHRLAIPGDPEGNGDGIVLPALLMALRFVEKGENLHFCWDL